MFTNLIKTLNTVGEIHLEFQLLQTMKTPAQ